MGSVELITLSLPDLVGLIDTTSKARVGTAGGDCAGRMAAKKSIRERRGHSQNADRKKQQRLARTWFLPRMNRG